MIYPPIKHNPHGKQGKQLKAIQLNRLKPKISKDHGLFTPIPYDLLIMQDTYRAWAPNPGPLVHRFNPIHTPLNWQLFFNFVDILHLYFMISLTCVNLHLNVVYNEPKSCYPEAIRDKHLFS